MEKSISIERAGQKAVDRNSIGLIHFQPAQSKTIFRVNCVLFLSDHIFFQFYHF